MTELYTLRDGPGGLPQAVIANDQAAAVVSVQGAHVVSFVPRGGHDLLWVSAQAVYAPNTPIRGGVPLCWPWFGPHPTDTTKPAHGFVRNRLWQIAGAQQTDAGTALTLTLRDDAATRALWPHAFALTLTVTVGAALTIALTHENTDPATVAVGGALHSYFPTAEIAQTTVEGLDGRTYLDQLAHMAPAVQRGPVTFSGEVDRIYIDTSDACVVTDAAGGRQTRVTKLGSRSTVVWNPWVEKAQRLVDFGDHEYRRMVCVETANAAGDVVLLAPGERHTLAVTING